MPYSRDWRIPRMTGVRGAVATVLLATLAGAPAVLLAQSDEPAIVMRALDLETNGKYRDAAALFRQSLRETPTPGAILGLERVYAELGTSDSLLAPLDTLIARRPREAVYRTVQLRTLHILRRDAPLRDAFERWVREVPRDAAPYREYARLLLQSGRSTSADSVVQRGRAALGGGRELENETAQLLSAQGRWVASAAAWRRALGPAPHLAGSAAYALSATARASRDSVRAVLLAAPMEVGARHALAELELSWGRPDAAWSALESLPGDSATASLWEEFGDRASAEGQLGLARSAFVAAARVAPTRDRTLRAALAALKAGASAEALAIMPAFTGDSATDARDLLALRVQALSAAGRARDAELLVARYDRFLTPGVRASLARVVASAWVRLGDLARARGALQASGAEGDSSEAAGWIALYEGRLKDARILLKGARDQDADLALALGIVARTRSENAPEMGAAFLALARGDTVGAASRFETAAATQPEAASALLLGAARLQASSRRAAEAIRLWQRLVSDFADSPEAAEAELEWGRALRRSGDRGAAQAHLEHLILTAPGSALVPQARRELDLVKGIVPP